MRPASLLASAAALACRRAALVLAAALVFTGAALAYIAGHIALNSDASALISERAPWRAAEVRMDRAFPGNGDAILVVIDGRTPELAEAAAAALTPALLADRGHFLSVTRPDGGDFFAREGLLYLPEAEVRTTTARMIEAQPFLGPLAGDPSLRGIAGALGTMIEGVARGQAPLDRIATPMAKLADALEAQAAGKPAFFSWQAMLGGTGALAAPTRRLILTRPRLALDDLMPGAPASEAIRAAAARRSLDPAHGVTVRLTGATPLSDEEFGSLAENWWQVALAMVVAMVATLWLAVRSARLTAAILVTTFAGLIATTALGLAVVGPLNLISVAFIPLFVGLGVDFGIQLAVRFQAERAVTRPPFVPSEVEGRASGDVAEVSRLRSTRTEMEEAFPAAATAMGPSLLLAAGAVCLGFLAFLPTSYRGIAELGLIASIGMAVALIGSVTLLPALVTLAPPGRPRAEMGSAAMAPLDRWLHRRRKAVLWGFALSMLASIALLPLVRFDFDPLHLRAQDSEAMTTLASLMADPDRNPNTADLLAADLPTAKALAKRLEASPEVARVITIESFVPADQAPKLAAIADAKALLDLTLDPIAPLPPPSDAEVVAALRGTATALRAATGSPAAAGVARRLAIQFDRLATGPAADRAKAADLLVRPLGTMLGQLRASLQAEPVTLATLPAALEADWIAPGGQYKVTAVPKAAWTDGAGLKRFGKAVLAIDPAATGTAISTQGAAATIAGAFITAGLLALAIVFALLMLALRDVREVCFTLAPVVLSGFLTLGTCVLIGQPINFANIIAFPLLFGVGVAFHIYFVMAWRGGATDLLQSSLARAVFFSALATGTAFGSLWLSHHPGTASMGKVLMLSLAWTLVCALIFEPALLGPPQAGKAGQDRAKGPA